MLKQYCATEFEGPAYSSCSSPSAMGVENCFNPCPYTHTHKEKCMLKPIRQVGKKGKCTNMSQKEYGCYRDHFKKVKEKGALFPKPIIKPI